jgi:Putative member of DMT superfamily (DUF486)
MTRRGRPNHKSERTRNHVRAARRCHGLAVRSILVRSHRMSILVRTIVLLAISNVFMTFAWYAHLRNLHDKPWFIAALLSWALALLEYLFQVPANRIGYSQYSVGQLKISSGRYYPFGLRALRHLLHAAATQARFSVGCPLHGRRGVFHVSLVITHEDLTNAMERTANRSTSTFKMTFTTSPRATRGPVCRRSFVWLHPNLHATK